MKFWTIILSAKASIFLLIAAASFYLGYEFFITMTYGLTGVVIILIGILLDSFEPELIDVLLRHDSEVYLLKIYRTRKGALYAPKHPILRKLQHVKDVKALPDTILGCPRFTVHGFTVQGIGSRSYKVLGEHYC